MLVEGETYTLMTGRKVKAVTLKTGRVAVPFTVKCHRKGCRTVKRGYLGEGYGGDFYDKDGNMLAELRDQVFVCSKHENANG